MSQNVRVLSENPYRYKPLEPVYEVLNYPIILIGVTSVNVQPWWYLGAYLSQYLYISPSFSNQFPQGVQVNENINAALHRLTLFEFKDFGIRPYLLAIEFPYWLKDIYLEVWEYRGTRPISINDSLLNLELKLNQVENKIDAIGNSNQQGEFEPGELTNNDGGVF